jgi:hypothetical protein
MATTLTKGFADLISVKVSTLNVALIRQDGTECQGGGYQRQAVGTVQTSEDANYVYIQNAGSITFPVATEDIAPATNPITQITLYDNATVVATIDLTQSKTYLTQDQIIIQPQGLTIRFPKSNT